MDRDWARRVWEILNSYFGPQLNTFVVDYAANNFELLVAIILSQNTTEKNAINAFQNLKSRVGLDPYKIYNTSIGEIEEKIRVAGLYRQKARAIKALANSVVNGLDLDELLSLDVEKARRILLGIKGIGKKTVDVFLAIHGKRIMGLDTHAIRIAQRWNISSSASYDDIQNAYINLFGFVDNFDRLHKLLILLGKNYCTAKKPRCYECPISTLCPKKTYRTLKARLIFGMLNMLWFFV